MLEKFEEYKHQYEEFCKIDDFNLEDRAKRIPAEKHFWVARLHEAKIQKHKLETKKKKDRKSIEEKIKEDSPVHLNQRDLNDAVFKALGNIDNQLKELDLLIGYLEGIVKQITFIAQDIKNIVEIKKLEQL